MSAGIVGLTLTYAKMLTGGFQWCVRQSAEVENLVCGTILSFLTSVFFRRRMLQKSYVVSPYSQYFLMPPKIFHRPR